MSNLSDIGFPVQSEQDVNGLIENLLSVVKPVRCTHGAYYVYADASGAEMYLQGNAGDELVGFNPHYAGKSRRTVCLTVAVERDSSELDGGFHAWANPRTNRARAAITRLFSTRRIFALIRTNAFRAFAMCN
jgi:hypothetical protein